MIRLLIDNKDYLGDSVYAEWDGYALVLTTENGLVESNAIILDKSVIAALLRFVDRNHLLEAINAD